MNNRLSQDKYYLKVSACNDVFCIHLGFSYKYQATFPILPLVYSEKKKIH